MNITISGVIGSGKSTVCSILKERYGYEVVSSGKIFRNIAEKRGIALNELLNIAKEDKGIDAMIDSQIHEISKEVKDTVFDGRVAWNFVEDSFNVFILCDNMIAAERIFNENRKNEKYKSVNEAFRLIRERESKELNNYKEKYNINYLTKANYDLIIESSFCSPDVIADEIHMRYEQYKEKKGRVHILLNTLSLLPTQSFRDFNQVVLEEYTELDSKYDYCGCVYSNPVISYKDWHFWIVDGHHRVAAAAINKKRLIDIGDGVISKCVCNDVDDAYVKYLYDFEELYKMQFNRDYLNRHTDYSMQLINVSKAMAGE